MDTVIEFFCFSYKTRLRSNIKFYVSFKAFIEQVAAIPPLNIHDAACVIASDYHKKKHVLRLKLRDNSEFLLEAPSQNEMVEWLGKIKKLAGN